MSKFRRNDPCPCGSGKKYKHCCMNSGKSMIAENKTIRYMQTHDSGEILNMVVALQLNPKNRGAYERMERLARYAALTMHDGGLPVNKQDFIRIINEEFPFDLNEDEPCNLHADSLSAMAGSHIIFPGPASNAAELLQTLTDVLYMGHGSWPARFEETVLPGMRLILLLGDMMASTAGIKGITKGENRRGEILDYSGIDKECWISQDVMHALLARNHIAPKILDTFVIDVDMVRDALRDADPDKNPLFERPIIRYKDKYYFLLISHQADTLRRYILNVADVCGCLQNLTTRCHDLEWYSLGLILHSMGWSLTDIEIANPMANTKEYVCQFDENWLAYVLFSHDNAEDVRNEMASSKNVKERIKEVQTHLEEMVPDTNQLYIILSSTMGEMGFTFANGDIDEPYVMMNIYPFMQLAKKEQWKHMELLHFAESYRDFRRTQHPLIPMIQSMVDMYTTYKQTNYSFYMSDGPRPTFMVNLDMDHGYDLILDSKIEANRHALPLIYNGTPVSVPVVNDSKCFPMYSTERPSLPFMACVENSGFPIWVSCRQGGKGAAKMAETYGTAILYWIYRINELSDGKGLEPNKPIEISLEFDDNALKPIIREEDIIQDEVPYEFSKTNSGLHMKIHQKGLLMMHKEDNSGERQMMIDLIDALTEGQAGHYLVDAYIPEDKSKMILIYQEDAASRANPIKLLRPMMIHEYVRQKIMDKLPIWMKENGYGFEGKISEKEEKKQALNHMVDTLLGILSEYVKQYEYKALLKFAVWNYESLVWERDHKKMLNPAKAYCFGVNEKMREENNLYEQRLTQAGLSLRCLIEYLAAQPHEGGEQNVGEYELEYMMGLMEAVISYGEFSDAIHMNVSDQEVELLPSGRYGIYKDDFKEKITSFQVAYGEDMLAGEMRVFGERFKQKEIQNKLDSKYPSVEEINAAFKADWGVTYQEIIVVSTCMSQMCVNRDEPVLQMSEGEVIEEVCRLSGFPNETIAQVIERLSLGPRERYLQAPEGYTKQDVNPWDYNRELSFMRRFIVRETDNNGAVYLTFGLRNAIASYHQLNYLLFQAQLKCEEGSKLGDLKGKFSEVKGKIYNDHVRDYLTEHTDYVIKCDVQIKNDYPFYTDKDYGDVDVLAFDKRTKIAYGIECKDTIMAKNIRQMKMEIDKFFGREEKDKKRAWVVKHLGRHVWLNNHKEELAKYLNVDEVKDVKSMMLTSSVLPVSFLRGEESPLPILPFMELEKANGDFAKLLP